MLLWKIFDLRAVRLEKADTSPNVRIASGRVRVVAQEFCGNNHVSITAPCITCDGDGLAPDGNRVWIFLIEPFDYLILKIRKLIGGWYEMFCAPLLIVIRQI